MAKRNRSKNKAKRMKRNEEQGVKKNNSKYALKHRLQLKGIFSDRSPFKPESEPTTSTRRF